MRTKLRLVRTGLLLLFALAPGLRADVLEMQNGDRYSGKVLAVSAGAVVLDSEILGKISVPRGQVAAVRFGTNAALPLAAVNPAHAPATNRMIGGIAAAAPLIVENTHTNLDLSSAFRQLGADTNFVGQIRQQMLAGSPEAGAKFDEMVNGLLTGQLNLDDLRRQARSSADQLRELKRELGPEAGDSLDEYLEVLDAFVNETPADPANQPAAPQNP